MLSHLRQPKSLEKSHAAVDFYGTGIEIWAGFGLAGISEIKNIWANYEQHLRLVFSSFRGEKDILAFALKKCIK